MQTEGMLCLMGSTPIPIIAMFMATPAVPLIGMNRLQSGTLDAAEAGVHIIRQPYVLQ